MASADWVVVLVLLLVVPKAGEPPTVPPTLPTLTDCEWLVPLVTMALNFWVFSDLHCGQVKSGIIASF